MRLRALAAGLALCAPLALAEPDLPQFMIPNLSRLAPAKFGPWEYYVTEPDFMSALFNTTFKVSDESRLWPGYFIFSITDHGGPPPFGPQIRDNNGDLVFWGRNFMKGTQNPQFCDFKGHKGMHICANQIVFGEGRVSGIRRIYDNTYTSVSGNGYFRAPNSRLVEPNDHEFRMLPGGHSFLQPVYNPRNLDLRNYGGVKNGWVLDGCFQEINVYSKKQVFQWCYLDHYDVAQSFIFMNVSGNKVNLTSLIAGKGTKFNAWDFMHVNSIDKNEDGDYVVSGRHLDQALKIAGKHNKQGFKPGQTIWRLNGKHSDIKLQNFTFSRQHHISFHNSTGNKSIITVFNNAWEGRNKPGSLKSTGQIIEVDEYEKTARIVREYPQPEHRLAAAQGSIQILPNNGTFIDWGHLKQITEYDAAGEMLMHAHLSEVGPMDVYRAYKGPWVGRPKWKPKLLAYSLDCDTGADSPLIAWVSWNGATEVRKWRFYFKTSSADNSPWVLAGTWDKTGFETKADLLGRGVIAEYAPFARYVMVEPLDDNDEVMQHGVQTTETYVPATRLDHCNINGCHQPRRFIYKKADSRAGRCGESDAPAYVMMVLMLIGVESIDYLLRFGWAGL